MDLLLNCNSPLIFSMSVGVIPMHILVVDFPDVLTAEAILGLLAVVALYSDKFQL